MSDRYTFFLVASVVIIVFLLGFALGLSVVEP